MSNKWVVTLKKKKSHKEIGKPTHHKLQNYNHKYKLDELYLKRERKTFNRD